MVIPVHEEVLEPRISEVETGVVRVHTRVETIPVDANVDTAKDDVSIERVRVDRPVATAPEPWQDGDTYVIPVLEEIVVTEKRLIVREEIRITRRRVTEAVPIHDTVRREVVEIEQIPSEKKPT